MVVLLSFDDAVAWATFLMLIWSVIGSTEVLSCDLHKWKSSIEPPVASGSIISSGKARRLTRWHIIQTIQALRTILCLMCLILWPTQIPVGLLGIFACSLSGYLVWPEAQSGAEQMGLLVLGMLLAYEYATGQVLRDFAVGFGCTQLCIAYVSAGMHKLRSQSWRSGKALVPILCTASYGFSQSGYISHFLAKYGTPVCWCTIIWEITFPLGLLHSYLAIAVCTIGIVFHVSIAIAMGLNQFPLIFVSMYPIYIATSNRIATLLDGMSVA